MIYLKDLSRSFSLKLQRVFFKGSEKRQLQEQLDIHKLFLFTSYHAQHQPQQQQAHQDELAAHLIEQAKALPFEQQREAVQHNLHNQLTSIGRSIHQCLVQQHDRRPSATALEHAWSTLQKRQQAQHLQQQALSRSSSGLSTGGSSSDTSQQQQEQQRAEDSQQLISQAQLSGLLQQQLGYSLAVRPSSIQHQDAGLGLFVEGEVPPGALIALFPGLVYSKDVHRRMPGYPRMDIGNPYLTARYDGRIVDSLPWGRGWLADGSKTDTIFVPRRLGVIGSMAAASDGPRVPVPDTTWVKATTGEAASLEMLEGRNPLALAHFANHPAAGSVPNAIIASFSFKLQQQPHQDDAVAGTSSGAGGAGGVGDGDDSSHRKGAAAEPWLRAYVPNVNYSYQCSREDLLTQEVFCIGLVSVTTLLPGTEVLFNYRLSPSLLGRPRWYVPVDNKEENMRWA